MDLVRDYRTRFLFDGLPVRGLHVHLDEVWKHIASCKDYPIAIRRALGELLVAAALLSENLKLDGNLIVQVQGRGILKMLVAETASGRTVRATARWDEQVEIAEEASLTELLGGDGIFAITVQPQNAEQWQGIVPLEGKNIAQMLSGYMERSEQIQTFIALAADEQHAGGLLLQRLPEVDPNEEAWVQVVAPAQTVTADELLNLDTQHLLYRLFNEHLPRVFPAENLEFACTCSRSKVANMLLLLGAEEVGSTIEQEGSITANCDFCNEKYTFDEHEVNALFGMNIVNTRKQHSPLLQ